MRIAIVTHLFQVEAFSGGGVQSATYHLCKALLAYPAIELVVVRPLSSRADMGIVEYDGIRVMPLEYRYWHTRPIALLWTQGRQVRRALDLIVPDIVHVQDSSLLSPFIREPSVFTAHGFVEQDVLYGENKARALIRSLALRLTYGLTRRRIKNVIAVSPYAGAMLPPNPQRRVWNIPNAVSDGFFDITTKTTHPTVLFAGHTTLLKNVQGLIRGFAGMVAQCPKAELRLAGAGQDSTYGLACQQLVRTLGLESKVNFLGALDVPEIQEELSKASLLALCSQQENAPMCIAEAMAAGVPIVASRLGGIPWMLDNGRCGCLISDPMDTSQITAGMLSALEPDRWIAFSKAAKQRAEMFRSSRVAEQTIAVYRQILHSDSVRNHRKH